MGVSDEPRRGARRPRAQIAGAGRLEKQLGSLPVIADFSRRLDIAGIVDRACPMRDVGPLSHGQVIEALIANRLTSPKAMVAVADWAQAWAVDEVYGIDPDTLNDDRLGRALDVLAGQVDQVVGSIGAKAIEAFGIDVTRLHWDMTSISLYGAYRDTDDDYPAAAFGHPKDRRTDLKQIQAGLAVTADGAIPVFARAYDGNAAEISQVTDTMYALQALAASRSFLLVGDSKLISYANVTAMHDAQVTFIAPLAAARVPEGLFVSLDRAQATFVDYVADRDEDKRFSDRDSYRVCEDTMDLAGPRKKDPVLTLRRILVYSTADAAGKPTFAWSFDQAAINIEAAADGWYALLTNLPADLDATEVFLRYKDQPMVERRYGEFKGPLAVAPIFLRGNRRITALITVICLALLIFCLIEREVRRNLAPDTEIRGFYINDRRPRRPTGRLILQALDDLRLIPAPRGQAATIPNPDTSRPNSWDYSASTPLNPAGHDRRPLNGMCERRG